MKEAIGSSFVFTLVITFTGILIVMYVSSIAYTKGFKVRNKIIDIIDRNGGYTTTAKDDIEKDLSSIGYKIVQSTCSTRTKGNKSYSSIAQSDYNYCVYEYEEEKGKYYGVTVFLSIDIPLLGNSVSIPIYGESKLIYTKDQKES